MAMAIGASPFSEVVLCFLDLLTPFSKLAPSVSTFFRVNTLTERCTANFENVNCVRKYLSGILKNCVKR